MDLADPKTDVVKLLKEFKEWYRHNNTFSSFKKEFPGIAVFWWLSHHKFKNIFDGTGVKTDQLIFIWRRAGFIKQVDEVYRFTGKRL